ncbi:Neuropeptides B/W receptor type like [Actinidia chinensis var. chinensis]|uniref:Neuropeptides B/W receptor type like n=1 Tax=Actinidia chinensis var. chinensis TaxID=1590841 RepID=A0A2R6RFK0_ACTCC|nr:Neuropeptides B/W receptor type like [Actinidia chinensis var. chinensis]
MADLHILTESSETDNKIPLLNNTEPSQEHKQRNPEENFDTHLDKTLQRLEFFLSLLGFNQSSASSLGLSWAVFLVIGVAIPLLVLEVSDCSDCEKYQIKEFELDIVVSQACLAAVSLLCLSHNLRKYGIRKFLFVDRYSGQMARFRDEYIRKISDSIRLLVLWVLPCFILKTAREVTRIFFMPQESWWLSVAISFALIISWTYVTTIYLSACFLFHLVCNLQIIHFDDYGKSLDRDSDVMTTAYSGRVTFINGGDFAVSSTVQVVGIILCLNAAAKISHRAQGIASLASRWHAMATCTSGETSQLRVSNSIGNLGAANLLGSVYVDNSESDLESLDYIAMPTNTHLASYMSSYHKRQAFEMQLGQDTFLILRSAIFSGTCYVQVLCIHILSQVRVCMDRHRI